MKEIEILQSRLGFIDKRSAKIEAELNRLNAPGTYRVQELETELNILAGHRAVVDKLKELRGQSTQAAALARRDALRDARTKAIEKQCYETAEQFERDRDYRNARIWRLQALDARKQAEHEIQ